MEHTIKQGKKVELRDIKLSDAALLLDFFKLVNLETKNLIREPEEFTMTLNEERSFIRRVMHSINEYIFVAVFEDRIIGTIGFRSSGFKRITHRVSIGMSILQEFNNLGLGTIMMDTIIKKAKKVGKLKIDLEVREDNKNAIHLYEKFGFQVEGKIKNGFFVDNKFVDLLFMGKLL